MEKKYTLFLFAILLLSTSFYHCQNGAGGVKDFHLAQADTIIRQHNANLPEWERASKMEGNVTVTSTKYLITIDLVPDSSREMVSYFLQCENNETNFLSVPAGRAEVLFFDRHLIVNSLVTKRILYFRIKTDKKPAYLESLGDMKEYTGYGLGMRTVNKGEKLESAPFCSCIDAGSTGWNCPSGGMGALSCGTGNAIGLCKINCSGQTFACCDPRNN